MQNIVKKKYATKSAIILQNFCSSDYASDHVSKILIFKCIISFKICCQRSNYKEMHLDLYMMSDSYDQTRSFIILVRFLPLVIDHNLGYRT